MMLFVLLIFYTVYIEREKTEIHPNYDDIDLENCQPSDIVEGFKAVRSKGQDLEYYLDPENGLLDRLASHGIINNSEIKILQKITPYQLLNEELLRRIEIIIDSTSKQFIEALCEDGQDHITKFIVTAGCKTDCMKGLLPRCMRGFLSRSLLNFERLIEIVKLELLQKLVSANCITSTHQERVMRSEREDQVNELRVILQRRRYNDFYKFEEFMKEAVDAHWTISLDEMSLSTPRRKSKRKSRKKRGKEN